MSHPLDVGEPMASRPSSSRGRSAGVAGFPTAAGSRYAGPIDPGGRDRDETSGWTMMQHEDELGALLAGLSVVIALPVQWGDQDALGHVNNVVYFRWYESARIAYFERVGLMSGRAHRAERVVGLARDHRIDGG